jgi:hypothetical protein
MTQRIRIPCIINEYCEEALALNVNLSLLICKLNARNFLIESVEFI